MRIWIVLLVTCSLMALGSSGCKDEEGTEEATTEEGASTEAAPEGESAEGEKPAEAGEAAAPEAAEGAESGEEKPAEGEEAKSDLTEEQCKSACEHATKLSMSAMPENATDDMKAAIEKVLTEGCPANCLKAGTKSQVDCYLAAKTAMDLAACPK